MPAMTALRFDAVLSVKIIHRIEPGAETTNRHIHVYEMREVSLDSFCALTALITAHVFDYAVGMWGRIGMGFGIILAAIIWVGALAYVLGYPVPGLPAMTKESIVPNWF